MHYLQCMLEIEAKLQISDPSIVRISLEQSGARFVGKRFEINAFFDTADARLKSGDEGLRLRTITDESTSQSKSVITFKGKQLDGPMKQREEIEFGIDDFDKASALLGKLGFVPTLAFEKRREIWEMLDCEIVIDELPLLGWFVEVEGPSVESVEKVICASNLDGFTRVKKGYASMIGEAIRSGRAAGPIVRFAR